MKIKVDLSYVIDLVENADLYPVDKIETNLIKCDELWDLLGEGHPVYHRYCAIRILEEHSDD